MSKIKKRFMKWMFFLSVAFFHINCDGTLCASRRIDWERTPLDRKTLKRHDVQTEHVRLLQYFLSEEIVLLKDNQPAYHYRDHGIELWNNFSGKVIFRKDLPGKYVMSGEKMVFHRLQKKPRMYLVIYFEEPQMNLIFLEDAKGQFKLTKAKGDLVMFEGEKYKCEFGEGTFLQINTRQLADVHEKDRYIKGAPYINESTGSGGSILIVLASLFLLTLLLQI